MLDSALAALSNTANSLANSYANFVQTVNPPPANTPAVDNTATVQGQPSTPFSFLSGNKMLYVGLAIAAYKLLK